MNAPMPANVAKITESDDHDRRRARTLYRRRGSRAHAHAYKLAFGRFGEQRFQSPTAQRFEVGAHHRARYQEYANARYQRQDRCRYLNSIHNLSPIVFNSLR